MRLDMNNNQRIESGTIVLLSMIVIFAMSAVALSLAQTVLSQYKGAKQQLYTENAVTAAEAGISAAIAQLNSNPSFTTFSAGDQNLYSDANRGKATYNVSITTSGDSRIITSTGKSYRTTDNTQLVKTKVIRVVVAIQRDKISNSMIFGSGGVYLSQNSGLPKGNIYIRGQLSMEQGAFIGTSSLSANLDLANVGCGTTNWPEPCGTSNPPIKMLQSTPGSIYGTVCAKDQPIPTNGVYPGPTGSGLVPNCSPRVSAAPTFNKKAFVQSISTTPTNPSTFTCDFWTPTRTIPAGTRISGNLTISNGCTVYVAGDAYITGSLTINPGGLLRVADSVGTVRPTLVINQGISFTANSGTTNIILPNSSGTPMFMIVFGSTNTTCSANETIPSDTVQTCLTPSEARQTATPAAYGPSGGSVVANFTGAIFYAYYGGVSFSAGVTAQFYAIGTQGAWLGANTQFTTIGDDAPFANILSFPNYQIADYQQIY